MTKPKPDAGLLPDYIWVKRLPDGAVYDAHDNADHDAVKYIRADLVPVSDDVVKVLQDAKSELWDEWHCGMSQEDFDNNWLIKDIDKALSALKGG